MTFVDHLVGETPVAYTIHVWPTDDLRARSWGWSERRRKAYEQVAAAIALSVATQILEGGTFISQEIDFSCSIGTVKFGISQTGTTIRITISEFTSPDGPPPNGGEEAQPRAIDGLVLGLRGTNGYFHVVVFHGVLPSMPTSSVLDIKISDQIIGCIGGANPFAWLDSILKAIANAILDTRPDLLELDCGFYSMDIRKDVTVREGGSWCTLSDKLLIMIALDGGEIQLQTQHLEAPVLGKTKKGVGIFSRTREREPQTYGLPAFTAAGLRQKRQTNRIPGRYLH